MQKETLNYGQVLDLMEALESSSLSRAVDMKYVIDRNTKGFRNALKRYNQKVYEVSREHAYTDEKGVIVVDERGNFKYTKDQDKLCKAAIEKIKEEDSFVKPYKLKEISKDTFEIMGIGRLEVLVGILITQEQFDEAIIAYGNEESVVSPV